MHEIKYSDVIRGVLMFWALERSLKGRFWQYRINNLAVLACFLQLFVYYDTEGLHMPIVRNTICIRRTNRIFVQRVVQRFILWLRPDLQYVTTQATLSKLRDFISFIICVDQSEDTQMVKSWREIKQRVNLGLVTIGADRECAWLSVFMKIVVTVTLHESSRKYLSFL